ncbi:MAG: hypothetical protein ACI9HK_006156 [Pirellulaceae bacterium]|jgi:hypothetical protein
MPKHVLSHTRQLLRIVPVVFAVAIFAQASIGTVAAQSTLRWKFAKDDKLAIHYVQKTTTKTVVTTRPIAMVISMTVDFDWQVEDVSQTGEATIRQAFTRLQFDMDAGDAGRLTYDSAANQPVTSATRTIAESSKLLLGAETIIKMDQRGTVLSTELAGETAKKLERADDAIKQLLSAEGIRQMLGQAAAPLPEQSVAKGDTWKSEKKVQTPVGLIQQVTTYTSAGSSDVDGKSLEKIEIAATLNIEKPNPKSVVKEQSLSGEILFDNESGRLVQTTLTQTLKTEKPYRDKLVRVSAKTETTLTVSQ